MQRDQRGLVDRYQSRSHRSIFTKSRSTQPWARIHPSHTGKQSQAATHRLKRECGSRLSRDSRPGRAIDAERVRRARTACKPAQAQSATQTLRYIEVIDWKRSGANSPQRERRSMSRATAGITHRSSATRNRFRVGITVPALLPCTAPTPTSNSEL